MLSSIRKADFLFNQQPWLVFIFFTLLVVILRWATFYPSVFDWDESLYILVAQAWSEGNPPYTAVWDNKPPGIYVIFLIAISILGHSVFAVRIMACLFIAITCFFLYKIGGLIEHNGRGIGLLSGSLYAVITLGNDGITANTELFFVTFVVIAFYFFLANNFYTDVVLPKQYLILFIIGFLLGIGFEIKYVVLFDFLCLSLILVVTFIRRVKSKKKYQLILQTISILTLGFILPFIIASLSFWLIGHFDDYIYANFTANKLRTVDLEFSFVAPLKAIYNQIRDNHIFWFSVLSVTIYLLIAKTIPARERWIVSSLIVWFFITLLCICLVFRGSFYKHYFLQLSPSMCFITAYMIISLVFSRTKIEKLELKQYLIFGMLLILLIINTKAPGALVYGVKTIYFRHIKGIKHWEDTPALVAEYLKPMLSPDDYIYVVNRIPIVYFLTDAKLPTRYAFPAFLLPTSDLPKIADVDPLKELDLILQKQPVYIIKEKNYKDPKFISNNRLFLDKLNQALERNYQLEKSIGEYNLYKLNIKS